MIKVTNVFYRDVKKPPTEMRGYETFQLHEGCAVWTWKKEEVIIPIAQIAEMASMVEEESNETTD